MFDCRNSRNLSFQSDGQHQTNVFVSGFIQDTDGGSVRAVDNLLDFMRNIVNCEGVNVVRVLATVMARHQGQRALLGLGQQLIADQGAVSSSHQVLQVVITATDPHVTDLQPDLGDFSF